MFSILDSGSLDITQAQVIQDVVSDENNQIILSDEVFSRIGVKPNTRMKVLQMGDCLVLVNAAVYVVAKVRAGMKGEAERLGLNTEEDVYEYLNQLRHDKG